MLSCRCLLCLVSSAALTLLLLQYLHGILLKNPVVSDANRDTVVEALRSIAELVIWWVLLCPVPGFIAAAAAAAGQQQQGSSSILIE